MSGRLERWLMVPLAVVAGGAGALLLTSLRGPPRPPASRATPVETALPQAGSRHPEPRNQLSPWPAGSEASATTRWAPRQHEPPAPSKSTEQLADEFAEAIAAHENSPVDPSWARGARLAMRTDLDALGEDMDRRSSSMRTGRAHGSLR